MIRKLFRKIETRPAVERLAAALHDLLAASGRVSGLAWVDTVGDFRSIRRVSADTELDFIRSS